MRGKAAQVKSWRRPAATVGVIVSLFAVIFLILYFSNKPNYRDLEREFKRISANLPTDWQLVASDNNSGILGVVCLGVDNSACPSISKQYEIGAAQDPVVDQGVLLRLFNETSFAPETENFASCSFSATYYSCSVSGSREKMVMTVSIGYDEINDTKLVSLLLGQRSDIDN